ncbi:MAG: dephospho-CoA kinase [Rhodoferax sp.]
MNGLQHPVRVGLTGGIGSGKSTVAARLAVLGATVMDADAISRACTAPGGAAIPAICQSFGPEFIDNNGALDRARMRERVFADPAARQRLEAIVHPLVQQQVAQQSAAAQAQGARLLLFDVPLLVESGHWRARLDRVLVVDCAVETQIARVIARSGLSAQAVHAIVSAQASREQRLSAADAVIHNDGIDLEELTHEVDALAESFGLSSP